MDEGVFPTKNRGMEKPHPKMDGLQISWFQTPYFFNGCFGFFFVKTTPYFWKPSGMDEWVLKQK